MLTQTRWVIPAGGATMVVVRFASPSAGDFDRSLAFECVGGDRVETLRVVGRCEYPRVASDPETLFTAERCVKSRRLAALERGTPAGVFVKSSGVFEFGPLVNDLPEPDFRSDPEASEGDEPEGDPAGSGGEPGPGDAEDAPTEAPPADADETDETGENDASKTSPRKPPRERKKQKKKKPVDPPNVARVTMLNPSAFPCAVKLEARAPDDPESGEPGGEQDTFAVFPAEMTLAPGESREVKVTAYPKGDLPTPADAEEDSLADAERARSERLREKRGVIAATVEGNPHPATFAVSCVPTAPSVAVDFYPEKTAAKKRAAEAKAAAAAAAALAAAAEKKRARVLGVEAKRRAEAAKTKPSRRQPKADGEGDGEAEGDAAAETAAEAEETREPDEEPENEEASAETKPEEKEEEDEPPGEPGVFFGRRLCDETKAERAIVVRNDSLVPARWTLVPPEDSELTASLAVDKNAGLLAPGEETSVSFAFGSAEPEEVSALFSLRVFDEGGAFADAPPQVTEIKVEGETWKIDVDVAFPDLAEASEAAGETNETNETNETAEGEGATPATEAPRKKERLDFGLMKSTETATRRVVLTNNGKYAARFDFELRRLAKEVFTVEPSSGEIEPGASAECAVVFDVSRTADPNARRLKLVDAPDVVLTISEPEPVEEQAKSAMAAAKARTKKERDAASLLEDAEKKERRRAAARRVAPRRRARLGGRVVRRVRAHAAPRGGFRPAPARRGRRGRGHARVRRDEPRRVPVRGVRVRLRRA